MIPNLCQVWMTQSWLLSIFYDCSDSGIISWDGQDRPLLKCPNASTVSLVTSALKAGDIVFHAFPHNAELSLYDESLFNASLDLTKRVAERVGIPSPRTLSQRDVTGATRAVLPLLNAHGIEGISIGSGGPHDGQPQFDTNLFVWRDQKTMAECVFMHDHGYGGGTHVLPNGTAMYTAWKRDNTGPFSVESLQNLYSQLRHQYPNADVHASTFDKFLSAALPQKHKLPVYTFEIGSTWSFGASSDPLKNVFFRQILHERTACISTGECEPATASFRRFDRLLTKIPEHTWGADVSVYLDNFKDWANVDLERLLKANPFNVNVTVQSWYEQRSYIFNAVAALDDGPFKSRLQDLLNQLQNPNIPDTSDYIKVSASAVHKCGSASIGFSNEGIDHLAYDDIEWANSTHPLATFTYQTLSADDYETFLKEFGLPDCPPDLVTPSCEAFGKPNMTYANPTHREVQSALQTVWQHKEDDCHFLLESTPMPSEVRTLAGAPLKTFTHFQLKETSSGLRLNVNLTLVSKTRTRLPEALWLSFNPTLLQAWNVDILGQSINPSFVATNGCITHAQSSCSQ